MPTGRCRAAWLRARGRAVAWSLVVAVARSRGGTRAIARAIAMTPPSLMAVTFSWFKPPDPYVL
jgi:hypothetical protein